MKKAIILLLCLLMLVPARAAPRYRKAATADGGYSLREYDEGERLLSIKYFDDHDAPVYVKGFHALVRDWDDAGNIIRERYLDAAGNLICSTQGYAAVLRRYDDQGRVIGERYLDPSGEPTPCKAGYAAVECFYGAGEKPVLKRFFDAARASAGQSALDYDPEGKLIAERLLDDQGALTAGPGGYAAVTYRYDENGKVQQVSYFDADDRPVVAKAGYALRLTQRDQDGNIVLERFFGADGQPIRQKNGYCAIRRRFDDQGHVTCIEYQNADGAPVRYAGRNYAAITYDYDADGNRIRECYYDPDMKPVIAWTGGRAMTLREYDDQGRIVSERYYDAEGGPMFVKSGYAGYTVSRSGDGTVETMTYIRPDGSPVKPTSTLPYVKLRRIYDRTGRLLIKEEYLDADGNPARNRGFVYGRVHAYDALGRETRSYTVGKDGQMSAGRYPYAVIEYTYDAFGAKTAAYFSKSGRKIG